jgi:TrmH family RNA methyltransferase
MTLITSTQNQTIKDLLKLGKPAERKRSGLIVIEGYREIKKAVDRGIEISQVFYCPKFQDENLRQLTASLKADEIFEVSDHVFSRIAYRDNHDGLLVTVRPVSRTLDTLKTGENVLYLVIETVEKPGNLGAILRTADGAGVDAVIVCDSQTDLYNPNVIRASLGCLFTLDVVQAGSEDTIRFLKANGIRIYSAALKDSADYYSADFRQPCAIVLGSEAAGLSGLWIKEADRVLRIPMKGIADSLNVSVSAAILVFEAIRQRRT